MNLIYSLEYTACDRPSLFMAGPTPRSKEVQSWRPEAIRLLEACNFNGTVFVPEYKEHRDILAGLEHTKQIDWEHHYLDYCTAILMWVPRNMENMPAFTTNCEYGLYVKSGKLMYGRPDEAPKNAYLDYSYRKFTGMNPERGLYGLISKTLKFIKTKEEINAY